MGVNRATRKLYPVSNTPAMILALGENGLKPCIASIGLFNTGANNEMAARKVRSPNFPQRLIRDLCRFKDKTLP